MIKYIVYDDKMNRIGSKDTMEKALDLLKKRNKKHGNIILSDETKFYKGYGIKNGKVAGYIPFYEG